MSRCQACKRSIELGRRAHFGKMKCQSQGAGGSSHLGELSFVSLIARIGQVTYASKTGDRLLEEFQTLGHEFPVDGGEPGEIPAWSPKVLAKPDPKGLTNLGEADRKFCSRPFVGKGA